MKDPIYADNAATTRLSDTVLEEMLPYLKNRYGNASTLYRLGREAHRAILMAKSAIADCIGAQNKEIFITSGGTEADNWAIKGTARRLATIGKTHIISDVAEHHAVLNSLHALEREGFTVTLLPVDAVGRVDPKSVSAAIREDTALVSIMYANNEIGTIQEVREISRICHGAGVLFHTDAVQAIGTLPIDVRADGIDLMSASAHKFNGPKGIGFLYVRNGCIPDSILHGGEQESGHRAGTENVAAIVGMAKALQEACEIRPEKNPRIAEIRDRVEEGLLRIDGARRNGDAANRLPGITSLSFDGIDGQSLLFELDLQNLATSSGSACASGSITPSHVLLALGLPYELAHGTVRLSFGRYNTLDEVPDIIDIVTQTVQRLRKDGGYLV